ncbi:hypothetical protein [Nocardioides sp. SYSU DS0663]|uniref:hypothetical protein n=1 Tax=Nocardioides sp. SYSU DS0663 TaxID=3416445 RepID=UPI003F4C3299
MATLLAPRHRTRPAVVVAAFVLILALAPVTTGGAVYFSLFWAEAPAPSVGTVLFAVGFATVSALGVMAGVALARGSERGRRGVIAYATFGILFTLAKLIWWQETEAIVFGVVDVALLLLVSSRRARDWADATT